MFQIKEIISEKVRPMCAVGKTIKLIYNIRKVSNGITRKIINNIIIGKE